MPATRFFFYGTLMSREGRGSAIDQLAHPVSPALLRGDLYSVHGSFPAYVEGHGLIVGELWEANDESDVPAILPRLDAIEGYCEQRPETSMYLRVERALVAPQDTVVYTYLWNGDPSRLEKIPRGDWREYSSMHRWHEDW